MKLHKCNHLLSEAINNGLANIELAVLSAKAIRRGLSSCFLDVSFGWFVSAEADLQPRRPLQYTVLVFRSFSSILRSILQRKYKVYVIIINGHHTDCSLSDRHILSPFNPKYDNWICQIDEDLHTLFWASKLAKLVNLTKSVVIIWVKCWQNMLIW